MNSRGNIRDMGVFTERIWPWDWLNPCFEPTKIRLTDVDGLVERNGHLLFFEAKNPGQPITKGQSILQTNSLIPNSVTWFNLWGEPGYPETANILTTKGCEEILYANREIIKERTHEWFMAANGNSSLPLCTVETYALRVIKAGQGALKNCKMPENIASMFKTVTETGLDILEMLEEK